MALPWGRESVITCCSSLLTWRMQPLHPASGPLPSAASTMQFQLHYRYKVSNTTIMLVNFWLIFLLCIQLEFLYTVKCSDRTLKRGAYSLQLNVGLKDLCVSLKICLCDKFRVCAIHIHLLRHWIIFLKSHVINVSPYRNSQNNF